VGQWKLLTVADALEAAIRRWPPSAMDTTNSTKGQTRRGFEFRGGARLSAWANREAARMAPLNIDEAKRGICGRFDVKNSRTRRDEVFDSGEIGSDVADGDTLCWGKRRA